MIFKNKKLPNALTIRLRGLITVSSKKLKLPNYYLYHFINVLANLVELGIIVLTMNILYADDKKNNTSG